MLDIFVDADACPVKQEVYRVARRCDLKVTLVANTWMRVPDDERISLNVVGAGADAADDWIADHVEPGDIVVTADIPLAARCIKKDASVIRPSGEPFREESIGDTLAQRDLMTELRAAGVITGGPPPLQQRDRSNFLQQMDVLIQSIRRRPPSPAAGRPVEGDGPRL
ncbi:MAG: YaiI/YqxD family protein [Kiritimatiellia bacterium]|nr:YaiI/YqxD family protein [Kiritimatiellia bacterium]MDP6810456.1 YaiI/YqxD family protein [Kiritimatiellia bacterium]MDP7024523.1 YaiI/YqxD family protein [Kiritimatiellia bacterium]